MTHSVRVSIGPADLLGRSTLQGHGTGSAEVAVVYVLYIATAVAVAGSLLTDPGRTVAALRIAARRMLAILPAFLTMLVSVSVILAIVPDSLIVQYLGGGGRFFGVAFGSILGSVTLMPGFIAFPLCGILRAKGVTFMVISAFSTTLMMVGVLTYPVEQAYFGTRLTVLRNMLSFVIALVVAVATGFAFGELP